MASPIRVKVVYEVGWGPALPVPHLTRLPRPLLDTKGKDGNICHVISTVDLEPALFQMFAFA